MAEVRVCVGTDNILGHQGRATVSTKEMPVSKVDSRCFNLSQKINQFLSLENASRFDLTPPEFWKEIVQNEEAVSRLALWL